MRTTAALIFEAQRLCSEQILTAQQLATQNQPPEIHVSIHFWDRWNTWLDQQDPFAFALISAGIITLAGVGGWLLVASTAHPPLPPAPQAPLQSVQP